ncbi:MAG: IMP dehydrogenase [Paludibacteraceae bacterium]|nr:IMP dehydrogenase [Paludibacteraceae bacterium]MCK9615806.1 IMP dehydrogenase [Candidatus Omnitrophota bacterium]
MIKTKPLYSFSDIVMLPASVSYIDSRSQCNVYSRSDGMLPLITAPMFSVIDVNSFQQFINNSINVCLPRTGRDKWVKKTESFLIQSYGLDEFKSLVEEWSKEDNTVRHYALIDIANGHMNKLLQVIKDSKKRFGDRLWIMVGNVALPETFVNLAEAGADAVRLGIGTGNACFVDGTKITLHDGKTEKIENIKTGEMVKTHIGQNEVVCKARFKNKKKILTINKEITCTEEHKFWVVEKEDAQFVTDENIEKYAKWVEAKDLDESKHFLIKTA